MRILVIPSWYPTSEKPVNGIFVREQVDALSQSHDVRVLYLDVLPRGTKRKARHIKSHSRGYIEEIVEVPNAVPGLWQFAYAWRLVRAYLALRSEFKAELINCHAAVPAGWGSVLLKKLFRVPVVLTEHMSTFDSWLRRKGLAWMARMAYSGVDLVIAVSEGLKNRIEKHFKAKRIVLVPNIVDTSRFTATPLPPTEHGYRLLFVGLMDTPQKGISYLLEALAPLRESNIEVHTDLVGDGKLRPEYEALAGKLGLGDVVTFHGLRNHEEIAELMRESHALVLPSLHEALPLVIIEALASGRPVVATRCGGPEYMIDATNGLIVEPGQPEPLAQAIKDVLTHLERYDPEAIASAARQKYSREAVTDALEKVFKECITLA